MLQKEGQKQMQILRKWHLTTNLQRLPYTKKVEGSEKKRDRSEKRSACNRAAEIEWKIDEDG
jgi:hypothetical protein